MTKIEGTCLEVCQATEFVAIVTTGEDGPHLVGNWGEYMRVLGIKGDTLLFPVGHYRQTEQNLQKDNRVQLLVASKKVQGTYSLGQGCHIAGTAEILTSGPEVEAVKAKFAWARGAMLIHVDSINTQL